MSGVVGEDCEVTCIGDMPLIAYDQHGRLRKVLIKNVRCVPEFEDSLISVKQIWKESRAHAEFADILRISIRGKKRVAAFPFQETSNQRPLRVGRDRHSLKWFRRLAGHPEPAAKEEDEGRWARLDACAEHALEACDADSYDRSYGHSYHHGRGTDDDGRDWDDDGMYCD